MIPETLPDIPQEIIDAAVKVEHYMKSIGAEDWELCGIKSRFGKSDNLNNRFGDLIRLVPSSHIGTPYSFELVQTCLPRDVARTSALMEMSSYMWKGMMRQILFIDRDGFVEVWDILDLNKKA